MFCLSFASFLVLILRSLASQNKSTNNVTAKAPKQNQCGKVFSMGCCNCRDGRDGRDGQNGKDGRDGRDGIGSGVKGDKGDQGIKGNDGKNGAKGEKGEQGFKGLDGKNGKKGQKGDSGSPGKNPSGAIKFSDTADNCTLSIAGTVRYSTTQKALQFCDGSAWLPVLTAGKGDVAERPSRHCLDILNSGQSHGSGLYWIDPNGGSTNDSFQAFCDMETERGGWTLVATKVSFNSPSMIKPVFSTVAAKTKNADAASHIHPSMGDWKEVMFRFADVNTIRVIYNRKAGAPQKDKEEFDKFLMGKTTQLEKNVYGFYKYSPRDKKRNPTGGFSTISRLHFFSTRGISEAFAGTDKWLDMWNSGPDQLNNYIYTDGSKALGTKCIAGYCYLNKPIWVMVR